ncbi:hypothetical protein C8R44DRAFT_736196 [Mycena epipterygia]|nr:hypothetical protein C8R44DRAFT_736196 [Mycena epipterygia]
MDRNVFKSIRPDVRRRIKTCTWAQKDAYGKLFMVHILGGYSCARTVLSPTVRRGSIANAESSTLWSLTGSTPTIKRTRIDNDRRPRLSLIRSSWRACQRQIGEDLQWDYAQLYRKVSQSSVAVAAAASGSANNVIYLDIDSDR